MLCALWILIAAVEPPGRDTGFVPPPNQEPPPKTPTAPTGPSQFVAPGSPGPASKPWEARTPEELGWLYLKRKEPFLALTVYDEMLRVNPNDVGAKIGKANALYEIARFYQRRGRFEEAKLAYDEALKVDPSLANDEDFNRHRALLGPIDDKKKRVNVYDPRPKILQQPWIGAHLRFGAQGLVSPGLSIQPTDFLRVEAGVDPIFAGISAQLFAHMPWQWTPYLVIGGKLSFQYPPIGTQQRRPGFEVWQASFFNVGVGLQFRHPIGLYFAGGVDMLVTGAILPSQQASTQNSGFIQVVYPWPFPQVTFGWLFGG